MTATVLRACGPEKTAAASSASGGAFTAHRPRIEQPGHIGLFASKDNGSLSLTDAVIEGATERHLWLWAFGGTAKLRTVLLLDSQREGVAIGDLATPLDALDLDSVKHLPSVEPGSLVLSDRADAPIDVVGLRHLRARLRAHGARRRSVRLGERAAHVFPSADVSL